MLHESELAAAIKAASLKHSTICPDMAALVINKLLELREADVNSGKREKFGESLRTALNDYDVQRNRAAYKSVVGHFFNRRRQYAQQNNIPTKRLPHRDDYPTITDETGQVSLVI